MIVKVHYKVFKEVDQNGEGFGETLFDHTRSYDNFNKDGSLSQRKENIMIADIRKMKKMLNEEYPCKKLEVGFSREIKAQDNV